MESESSALSEILSLFDLTVTDGWMILVFIPLFVLLWKALSKYFFEPYFALIERREEATSGSLKKSQQLSAEATELEAECERQLTEVRIKAVQEKLSNLEQAKLKAFQIVDKANNEAQELLISSRSEVASLVNALRTKNQGEAESLAGMIVEKVQMH